MGEERRGGESGRGGSLVEEGIYLFPFFEDKFFIPKNAVFPLKSPK